MSENQNNKPIIGITTGDINGIGLEVILKTLADKRILDLCTPVIYSAAKVISYHKNIIKVRQFPMHNAKDIESIKDNTVDVINCWFENVKITLGKCAEEGGKYAYISLEKAVEDLSNGHLDGLVTAPINKQAMKLAGFEYPGHTEYLTARLNAKNSLMLMVHENLRVGLVTNHIPVSTISNTITKELVLNKIEALHQSLCMDFGVSKPTIAVLGLNPHAGDGGMLGNEENDVIIPAITKAKGKGILAIGPYPADGLFGSGNFKNFDGILAMFHDQGLVPFKTLAFGGGVNFTAGLSAIRTSPDHGTGFDIVGKGCADSASFRQALYLAIDAAKDRKNYLEMTANPLTAGKANEVLKEVEAELTVEGGDGVVDPQANQKKPRKKPQHNKPRDKGEREHQAKQQKPKPQEHKETTPKPEDKLEEKKEITTQPEAKEESQEQVLTENEKKNLTIEERLALAEQKKNNPLPEDTENTDVTE